MREGGGGKVWEGKGKGEEVGERKYKRQQQNIG